MSAVRLAGQGLSAWPALAGVEHLRNVVELDLSNNDITEVPPSIGGLAGLEKLNLMGNRLQTLPAEIAQLRRLVLLGLKDNLLEHLPALGGMACLEQLFLTSNRLTTLPEGLDALPRLRKLTAAWNPFASLPASLFRSRSLEFLRVSGAGHLAALPDTVGEADRLAWISIAGNKPPLCPRWPPPRRAEAAIAAESLRLGERLGGGASGDVDAASFEGREVVVKWFKRDVDGELARGPDGAAADEVAVLRHLMAMREEEAGGGADGRGHVVTPLGSTRDAEGNEGFVFTREAGAVIASGRPNMASVLRCRYDAGAPMPYARAHGACVSVARALSYLHAIGVVHGDVYGHNVVEDGAGHAVLCDFGASFRSPANAPALAAAFAKMDVRAAAIFMAEMAELCCAQLPPPSPDGAPPAGPQDADRDRPLALRDLARRTSAGPLATRPTAAELVQLLAALAPDAP